MDRFTNWEERTELLLQGDYKKLQDANILVVGLGGVGGIAAEMLCRAGVGRLSIVDSDNVSATNLNRQIFTTTYNIGMSKAEALGQKLVAINPNIKLNIISTFIEKDLILSLLKSDNFDYIIDAIDTLSPKVFLLYNAVKLGISIVSSMGAGGKFNPTLVQVDDISKSHNCSLARVVRKRLHRLGVYTGIKVVFSPEKKVENSLKFIDAQNKMTTLGTVSYLPNIFGIYASWVVIDDLIKKEPID